MMTIVVLSASTRTTLHCTTSMSRIRYILCSPCCRYIVYPPSVWSWLAGTGAECLRNESRLLRSRILWVRSTFVQSKSDYSFRYQDTVLSETGNQFFGSCYIEGAVDFIFGQHARTFFHKNTIASVAAGTITADGPTSSTDESICESNMSRFLDSCLLLL